MSYALDWGQSFVLILLEEALDEVDGVCGDIVELLVFEVVEVVLDVVDGVHVAVALEGGQAGQQHVGDDAHGPHVGAEADVVKGEHLRSQVLVRAHQCLDAFPWIVDLRHTKVANFDPISF